MNLQNCCHYWLTQIWRIKQCTKIAIEIEPVFVEYIHRGKYWAHAHSALSYRVFIRQWHRDKSSYLECEELTLRKAKSLSHDSIVSSGFNHHDKDSHTHPISRDAYVTITMQHEHSDTTYGNECNCMCNKKLDHGLHPLWGRKTVDKILKGDLKIQEHSFSWHHGYYLCILSPVHVKGFYFNWGKPLS